MYPMELKKKNEGQTNPSQTELVITLKVNAAKLYEIPYPPLSEDINNYCRLSDSNPKETHHEDRIEFFESEVKPGQQIRWVAECTDQESEYSVAIESIVYAYFKNYEDEEYKKENFFNAIAICSSDMEKVRAKINDDFDTGPLIYIYNLNFNIRKEGDVTRRYSIDPRLKIEK